MGFLTKVERLTQDQMVARIMSTVYTSAYKPQFFMLHTSGIPSLKNWEAWSDAQRLAYGDNLNSYYRSLGWSSGPLAMGMPADWSYLLCDPAQHNIHCSCCNYAPRAAQGVETLGDFRTGGDDPNSPLGKMALDNSVNILAALHLKNGYDPGDYEPWVKGLHFHVECKVDGHACPGNLINKPDIVARVRARMTEIHGGAVSSTVTPVPPAVTPVAPVAVVPPAPPPATLATLEEWPPKSAYPWFYDNMTLVFETFQKLSGSNVIACGLTAQAEAESSYKLGVVGDEGTAFGLFQWHGDRAAAILNGCGIDVKTASPDKQAEAVWWELNHLEMGALEHIRAANTAADAAREACEFYERAGAPGAEAKRAAMAERLAVHFYKP